MVGVSSASHPRRREMKNMMPHPTVSPFMSMYRTLTQGVWYKGRRSDVSLFPDLFRKPPLSSSSNHSGEDRASQFLKQE